MAEGLKRRPNLQLVVDPVLVATSGDSLATSDVGTAIVERYVLEVMHPTICTLWLVVDPVLVATSGDSLADSDVGRAYLSCYALRLFVPGCSPWRPL